MYKSVIDIDILKRQMIGDRLGHRTSGRFLKFLKKVGKIFQKVVSNPIVRGIGSKVLEFVPGGQRFKEKWR